MKRAKLVCTREWCSEWYLHAAVPVIPHMIKLAVKDEAGENNYKTVARKDSDTKNDASSNSCVR